MYSNKVVFLENSKWTIIRDILKCFLHIIRKGPDSINYESVIKFWPISRVRPGYGRKPKISEISTKIGFKFSAKNEKWFFNMKNAFSWLGALEIVLARFWPFNLELRVLLNFGKFPDLGQNFKKWLITYESENR